MIRVVQYLRCECWMGGWEFQAILPWYAATRAKEADGIGRLRRNACSTHPTFQNVRCLPGTNAQGTRICESLDRYEPDSTDRTRTYSTLFSSSGAILARGCQHIGREHK